VIAKGIGRSIALKIQQLPGHPVAVEATKFEANAVMPSIVQRDQAEDYQAYLTRLAAASGIETPTRDVLVRFDRKQMKKSRNKNWRSQRSRRDGREDEAWRTHLAHKPSMRSIWTAAPW